MTRRQSDSERAAGPPTTRETVESLLDVGRWRTLMMLRAHGPAKPHEIAKTNRLSAKETLEHLQILRDFGIAERDDSSDQDRWAEWRASPGRLDTMALAASDDQADQEAYTQWLDVITQHQMMAIGDWLRSWTKQSPEIRSLADSEEALLVSMSVDDMRELHTELADLAKRWAVRARTNRERGDDGQERRPVFLITHMIPFE